MIELISSFFALMIVGGILVDFAQRSDKLRLHLDLSCAESFHIDALCVALTDALYGGAKDYTGRIILRNVFIKHGLAEDCAPLHDPTVVERAMEEVQNLNWQQIHSSGTFILCFDLGYADHVRMAFQMLGVKLQNITYLTLMVFAVSAIVFFTAFWPQPALLWTVTAITALLSAVFFGTHTKEMPTLNNRRSLSFLAILPAIHILLVIAFQMDPTPIIFGTVVVQALIFAYAIWIRNSSGWLFLALLLLIAALGLSNGIETTELREWFRQGVWAAPLWLGVVKIFLFLKRRKVHASYRCDAAMINYPKWHSAYIGLQLDAETFQANRLPTQSHPGVDANGYEAGYHITKTNPQFTPPENAPILNYPYAYQTLNIGWGLYERAIKQAFFDYIKEHGATIPRLYLYLKPKLYLSELIQLSKRSLGDLKHHIFLVLVIVFSALASGFHLAQEPTGFSPLALVTGALIACSPAPMIWAHSSPLGMRDQVWITLIGLWVFLICLPLYLIIQTLFV